VENVALTLAWTFGILYGITDVLGTILLMRLMQKNKCFDGPGEFAGTLILSFLFMPLALCVALMVDEMVDKT